MKDKIIEYDELVINLRQRFPDEEACLKFLAEFKWKEGFVCRKCGHTNYCKGKKPYSRRCTRCKKEESAMANTIFHRCKIPMTKAFEMAFMVCNMPEISSGVISKKLEIRQMTCYTFQKKIQLCLQDKSRVPILVELLKLS